MLSGNTTRPALLVGLLLLACGLFLLGAPAWAQEGTTAAAGGSDAWIGVGATATTSGGIILAGWQFVTRKLTAISEQTARMEGQLAEALKKHGENLELVRELLTYLKAGAERAERREGERRELQKQINDLHKWHDKTDTDGVPIWYVRSSMEEAIKALGSNVNRQTEVFRELVHEIRGASGNGNVRA